MDVSKKQKNIFDRQCRECGNTFKGGPRAWYCQNCRAERIKEQNRKHKQLARLGHTKHIGDILQCVDCGKDYEYNFGVGDRCPECAKLHLKMIDNQQSQDWKRNNKDKYLKAKRDFDKRRRAERESKPTGQKYICYDKANGKFRVVVKGKHVGYFANLDDAIAARDDKLKMM